MQKIVNIVNITRIWKSNTYRLAGQVAEKWENSWRSEVDYLRNPSHVIKEYSYNMDIYALNLDLSVIVHVNLRYYIIVMADHYLDILIDQI